MQFPHAISLRDLKTTYDGRADVSHAEPSRQSLSPSDPIPTPNIDAIPISARSYRVKWAFATVPIDERQRCGPFRCVCYTGLFEVCHLKITGPASRAAPETECLLRIQNVCF